MWPAHAILATAKTKRSNKRVRERRFEYRHGDGVDIYAGTHHGLVRNEPCV